MAQSTIKREMFTAGVTLASGTLGQFTAFPTGSVAGRIYGPTDATRAAPGASAIVSPAIMEAQYTAPSAVSNVIGMHIGGWIRPRSFAVNASGVLGTTNVGAMMFSIFNGAATPIMVASVGFHGDGSLLIQDPFVGQVSGTFSTFSPNVWRYLGIGFIFNTSTNSLNYRIISKLAGASIVVEYTKGATTTSATYLPATSRWTNRGFQPSGFDYFYSGRVGAVGQYRIATAAETIYPADLTDPIESTSGYQYYVDTVSGSDTNTGASGAPWQTATKLAAEILDAGVMPTSAGQGSATRSTVYITAPLTTPLTCKTEAERLVIGARGVRLTNATGLAAATPWHQDCTNTITGWALIGGANRDKIYKKTGGGLGTGVGLMPRIWQNGTGTGYVSLRWYTLLKLADYANLAALLTAMNNTSGFDGYAYADDTDLYIRTIGDVDPATLTIKVSPLYSASDTSAVRLPIDINCEDVEVDNYRQWGYAVVQADLTPLSRGLIGDNNSMNVLAGAVSKNYSIHDCEMSHAAKHFGSFASNQANSANAFARIVCHQATPQGSSGQLSAFAIAPQGAAVAALTYTLDRMTYIYDIGDISAARTDSGVLGTTPQPALDIHGDSDGVYQIAQLDVTNCTFATSIAQTNDSIPSGKLTFDNTICRDLFLFSTLPIIRNGCRINGVLSFARGIKVFNSIIAPGVRVLDTSARDVAGAITIEGVTIDLTGCTTGGTVNTPILKRAGVTTWTSVKDVLLIVPLAADFVLGQITTASDTVTAIDYNGYQTASGGKVWSVDGAAKTFAQWAALASPARDTHSFNSTDLKVTADWRPRADSSLKGGGTTTANLAGVADFYKVIRPASAALDIGAAQAQTTGTIVAGSAGNFYGVGSYAVLSTGRFYVD